jgi:hypothetical protein
MNNNYNEPEPGSEEEYYCDNFEFSVQTIKEEEGQIEVDKWFAYLETTNNR